MHLLSCAKGWSAFDALKELRHLPTFRAASLTVLDMQSKNRIFALHIEQEREERTGTLG